MQEYMMAENLQPQSIAFHDRSSAVKKLGPQKAGLECPARCGG
jgi:hypothetical protein